MTPGVILGLAFIGDLVETEAPDGPYFEAAIIHHTDCGSAWLAEDEELRHGFAQRIGYDDQALADLAVVDPSATVRADVERVLSDPGVSPRITVSGHVYDVDARLVTTIVEPVSPARPPRADRHECHTEDAGSHPAVVGTRPKSAPLRPA